MLRQKEAQRGHHVASEIMVQCHCGRAGASVAREFPHLDNCLGIHRDAQDGLIGVRALIDYCELVEYRVGFWNLFQRLGLFDLLQNEAHSVHPKSQCFVSRQRLASVAFLHDELTAQLRDRESGVEAFMAKLRISLAESINDCLYMLKQIGQIKLHRFATTQVASGKAAYAAFDFVLAQPDGCARPPQLGMCTRLAAKAELFDGIGHELPACAALESRCGFLQENDYGFGEIQSKLQSGFCRLDWKALMTVLSALAHQYFSTLSRRGSLCGSGRKWSDNIWDIPKCDAALMRHCSTVCCSSTTTWATHARWVNTSNTWSMPMAVHWPVLPSLLPRATWAAETASSDGATRR